MYLGSREGRRWRGQCSKRLTSTGLLIHGNTALVFGFSPILLHLYLQPGTDPEFQVRGGRRKVKKKNLNTHPYSINKLSIKTNTQKSLFLNMKYYCFLIQSSIKRELNTLSNLQNHLHYCILIQSSNPIPLRHYRHQFTITNISNQFITHQWTGPALPFGELGNCLRPPSPKILEKNRAVVSNELQK